MNGQSCRILVIEDDPATRDVITRFLVDEGYQVTSAGDVATALTMSPEQRPRLILLDVMLRGTAEGGARLVRETLPGVAIVAMSALPGFGGPGVLQHVDATLAKPFDLEVLLATVERFDGSSVEPLIL